MNQTYLECRDLAHAWEHVGDELIVERKRRVQSFSRMLVCTRCTTQRIDSFQVQRDSIEKVKTKYHYPKGYLVQGQGRVPVRIIRWELFQKLLRAAR
jgi:hypothetical protein